MLIALAPVWNIILDYGSFSFVTHTQCVFFLNGFVYLSDQMGIMNWESTFENTSCFAQICFNNKKYTRGSNLIHCFFCVRCCCCCCSCCCCSTRFAILPTFLDEIWSAGSRRRIESNLQKQSITIVCSHHQCIWGNTVVHKAILKTIKLPKNFTKKKQSITSWFIRLKDCLIVSSMFFCFCFVVSSEKWSKSKKD